MSTESAIGRWKQMAAEGSARHMLVDEHVLHLYYGIDQAGLPIFFAITSLRPQLPPLRGVMISSVRQRGDGQYVATLTLANGEYADTFMRMCMELARRTHSETSEENALAAFITTLKQWQRLLAHHGAQPLSDRQVRGLLGELRFARNYLGARLEPRDVIAAWEGPLGAPQDFRHDSMGLFEVKAIRANTPSVLISSVRQLDPDTSDRFHLVTIEIADDSLAIAEAAVSVLDEIDAMREFIGGDTEAMEQFEDRLARLGLDTSEPHYSEGLYTFGKLAVFVVESDFPRLKASNTPLGVEEVTYRVRLDHLGSFARSIDEAMSTNLETGQ